MAKTRCRGSIVTNHGDEENTLFDITKGCFLELCFCFAHFTDRLQTVYCQPKIGQVLSPLSFYSRPFTAATAIFLAVALIQMERWRRRRQQQQMGLNHLSGRIGLVTVETGCETQMAAASALQTIPKRTLRTRSACTCSKVTGENAPEDSAAVVNKGVDFE